MATNNMHSLILSPVRSLSGIMRILILVAAIIQTVLGGGSHFAVRLPFLNPAGVTYLDGPAPAGLAAGPLQYAAAAHAVEPAAVEIGYAGAPAVTAAPPLAYAGHAVGAVTAAPPVAYAGHAFGAVTAAPPVAYAGPAVAAVTAAPPVAYAAPAPAPIAYAAPAPAHLAYAAPAQAAVGYAAAAVPAVAAVPTVHHVPGVADVPVTRVEAQPGVIQKIVDVAKPAVSTRKFQLRRPAIEKKFYDIEERVIVRPAGSALVELEEPHAKIQQGPAVINPVGVALGPVAAAPVAVGHPVPAAPIPLPVQPISITPSPAPVFVSTTPAPIGGDFGGPSPGPAAFQDDESVVVDNPDFAARSSLAAENHQLDAEQHALDAEQQRLQARQQNIFARRQHVAQARTHTEALPAGPAPVPLPGLGRSGPAHHGGPGVEVRANGAPLDVIPHARAGPDVVPSVRALSPEVNQANQQRLIQLLTARGGVAEVGFGRAGPSEGPVGDAGPVRARVLSATSAPPHAAPAGERVSTRRVVVSRPIETVQDIDVVEPVTKLERVAINQPTLFKTVHHDVARVPTSVPVLGKTLQPAVAHAAVPVGFHAAHLDYIH
ncbi:hypothetical protein L9F63_014325 [Diploptera punctata]|uniref:Uncharacterized protein n=1 Tax=Diploptera punctata TaxID=6984 RepID=A0AAD8AAC1_DIPPU|nr:hypothetical protein L9F63_014325 [Diploptera punctata]